MKGRRPFTDEEVKAMLEGFAGMYAVRNRTMFVLGIYTGFRIQELLSVRRGDVWDGRNVADYLTVRREAMKGGAASRTVYLPRQARLALADLVQELNERRYWHPSTYLFRSWGPVNKPIGRGHACDIIKHTAQRCGIEAGRIGTHSMRKTFAGKLYRGLELKALELARKGVLLNITREAMKGTGHESIKAFEAYMNFDDEHIRAVADGFAACWS